MKIRHIFVSIGILLGVGIAMNALFDSCKINDYIQNNNVFERNFIYIISLIISFSYLQAKCPIDWHHIGYTSNDIIKTLLWGSIGWLVVVVILFPYKVGNYYGNIDRQITSENEPHIVVFLFFIAVTLFIPIFEELFYRSGVYRILKSKFTKLSSVLISSILFTVLHLPVSMISFIKLFLASLIFIFVYEKSSKVGASITSHIICNLVWYSAAYSYRVG